MSPEFYDEPPNFDLWSKARDRELPPVVRAHVSCVTTRLRPGKWEGLEPNKAEVLRPKSGKPKEREETIVSQTEKQVGRERAQGER